jgi:hypothetical protein
VAMEITHRHRKAEELRNYTHPEIVDIKISSA